MFFKSEEADILIHSIQDSGSYHPFCSRCSIVYFIGMENSLEQASLAVSKLDLNMADEKWKKLIHDSPRLSVDISNFLTRYDGSIKPNDAEVRIFHEMDTLQIVGNGLRWENL
jgi:hypothetical protein